MTRRRVVITGLGVVSPVGNTVAEAWQNILAGRSGIAQVTKFDTSTFPVHIAGEVRNFDITSYISAKDARRMDHFIHFGMAAGIQAVRDAGLDQDNAADLERVGVSIGSGIGGLPLIEGTKDEYNAGGVRKVSPFFVPGSIINMISVRLVRFQPAMRIRRPPADLGTETVTGLCLAKAPAAWCSKSTSMPRRVARRSMPKLPVSG